MTTQMINRGHGLVDLIAGKTPTYVDWTNDPTDGEDITDGNIATFCTTGNKVTDGAWQYAYFEWNLNSIYNVICTGFGHISTTAGSGQVYISFWNGTTWYKPTAAFFYGAIPRPGTVHGDTCSKIRFGLTSDAAATITQSIREFHVWRL